MINHQRSSEQRNVIPKVIRPDLLLTEDGFTASELDGVPGGIGTLAWLSQTYAKAGFEIFGGPRGMLDGFASLFEDGGDILVSEESEDYRPEMDWLAGQMGDAWSTESAEEYQEKGKAIYRFFELYDWEALPFFRKLAEKSATGKANVTPPFKPHLEDKLWLALFWSPALKKFWEKSLRESLAYIEETYSLWLAC